MGIVSPIYIFSLTILEMKHPNHKNAFCRSCRTYKPHGVSVEKSRKACDQKQGQRRYLLKNTGYKGQTKPVFKKKAKQSKKIVLKLTCSVCKKARQQCLGRSKRFQLVNV